MPPKTVKYLKEDRGRFFYRRRVPKQYHKTLGITVWTEPCGDVSYAKAVSLVTGWAEEHDALLAELKNPQTQTETRRSTESAEVEPLVTRMIDGMKTLKDDPLAFSRAIDTDGNEIILDIAPLDPLKEAKASIESIDSKPDPDRQLAWYRGVLATYFGQHVDPPSDPDERDEYDLVKRKLERRIAGIAGDPNTISAVAERYYDFSGLTKEVRNKYRRSIKTLIDQVGDIPLNHLTASKLRAFREQQSPNMQPTSLWALFTPIRGIFRYAVENEIVELNPMPSVPMPKEKRSIQMRKWQPFSPEEAQRIFLAMDDHWGSPRQGLSEQRRKAIHMVVRVQAFTCMRPKEVLTFRPENVTDKSITVIGSKTEGSDRCIPLHPEIKDFPAFFHAGGFNTFKSQNKDQVQTIRHNFTRLIREIMDPPIKDKKKVLYSWRSTFSNAMRRAGADAEMRRAILGHAEAGSLKHYDDGPEFAKKRKWVRASDPRTVYPDAGEDDDLD